MLFIDTGAFLARYLSGDSCHLKSAAIWKKIAGEALFTCNHVLEETLTLLSRSAGYNFAADRAQNIYSSPALEILFSSKEDEIAAIGIFRKYADQTVSFTDCISFVLMRRQGIKRAFTFDRHFAHAGFRAIGVETES